LIDSIRDGVSRTAGHAHVTGDAGDVERAVVADLEGLRRAIDLLGALPCLGVAIEPAGTRPIVEQDAFVGDCTLGDRCDRPRTPEQGARVRDG
jgi:hypothetical protein